VLVFVVNKYINCIELNTFKHRDSGLLWKQTLNVDLIILII